MSVAVFGYPIVLLEITPDEFPDFARRRGIDVVAQFHEGIALALWQAKDKLAVLSVLSTLVLPHASGARALKSSQEMYIHVLYIFH